MHEFDRLLSEQNSLVRVLHSSTVPSDVNEPYRQAEKLNEIINSVQDVVEKERPKPLPMKKGGNITIAPNKIPLAKGRLQQMR